MKKLALTSILFICMFLTNSYSISLYQLKGITQRVIYDNDLGYTVSLVINDYYAGGFATSVYNNYSNHVVIYVDSRRLAFESFNTWAFVIGHELGHKFINAGNYPQAEKEADIYGAYWAINSGYDLSRYIEEVLMPRGRDICTHSHGCQGDRARLLAERFGLHCYKKSSENERNKSPKKRVYGYSLLGQ